MVWGKKIRLNRITANGKMICIPMDHGITIGPVKGLIDMGDMIERVREGGATAALVHKGIIRSLKEPPRIGLIMHLSGSTNLGLAPNRKVQVGSVEEAVRLGADAVSLHINIGCKEEPEMLATLGSVADDCDTWGMPLIAMMYPRGENVKDPNKPDVIAHVARIGAELGADIIKTVYTGDLDSFKAVVKGCPVPIVIAGGPKSETDRDIMEMVYGAIHAGAIGVACGRNVFQHDHPEAMVRALYMIIMQEKSVEEALEALTNV
ncbi:MAG: class I fructose-bisphosphate aldolase family protein [archaeon]|nr:class I fructose-bisphosphate aldolase family protein [archaeon]MCP8306610.1 class I fructose-bisphosphate aldolase family protein [archaeon]